MDSISKRMKAVADTNRLRALALLSNAGECCVCDIQVTLEISLSAASRALRQLEDAGWTQSRRNGRWNYSRIAEAMQSWQVDFIRELSTLPVAVRDHARYLEMKESGLVCEPDLMENKENEFFSQS